MIYFLFNIIIWTLALYGLLEIIKTIIYAYTYSVEKPDGIYIIVATKNQEKNLEMFLRTNIQKLISGKEENRKDMKDIILVDLASSDNTKKIAEKMSIENNSIRIMEWDECKNIFDQIIKDTK